MNYLKLLALTLWLTACQPTIESDRIEYFTNPIMQGFYPDPSICKAGEEYFLIQSSFSYFPGLPIFKSTDLINWKQIGHVMNRPSQLNSIGARMTRGLFAPTIRFHDGMFYVICTEVDRGGNFIVTSEDPSGPWSDPVYFPKIDGIDPSMFFEEEKTYITYNSIPPDNKPLWNGHRTIRMWELDRSDMQLKGDNIILVDGGTDRTQEPVWIEGPHIYKVNDYYYLLCAEGGTSINHSEVVFRSKNVKGPYIPYERNPILTQRHLESDRPDPITTTGHADMVQLDNGDWWAVFLGCRPYETVSNTEPGYFNLGRETFLAPVKWVDGWPIINPDFEEVQYQYPVPIKGSKIESQFWKTGNFEILEEFEQENLAEHWTYLRTPNQKWWNLMSLPGSLQIDARPETCSDLDNPSFIGRRMQHIQFEASAHLDFTAKGSNEQAGLVAFQNEQHYYGLCKSFQDGTPVVQLFRSIDTEGIVNNQPIEILESQPIGDVSIELKIISEGSTLSFHYREEDSDWQLLKDNVDAKFLSTKVAGGFIGSFIGMYATANGQESNTKASFDWFSYRGEDDIYKTLNPGKI